MVTAAEEELLAHMRLPFFIIPKGAVIGPEGLRPGRIVQMRPGAVITYHAPMFWTAVSEWIDATQAWR